MRWRPALCSRCYLWVWSELCVVLTSQSPPIFRSCPNPPSLKYFEGQFGDPQRKSDRYEYIYSNGKFLFLFGGSGSVRADCLPFSADHNSVIEYPHPFFFSFFLPFWHAVGVTLAPGIHIYDHGKDLTARERRATRGQARTCTN